jgi:hypothetical protein
MLDQLTRALDTQYRIQEAEDRRQQSSRILRRLLQLILFDMSESSLKLGGRIDLMSPGL